MCKWLPENAQRTLRAAGSLCYAKFTMYPQGKAQTATRPVGNCAGRRTERVMHTIAKASLQADPRVEMFRKSMDIAQNQAKMAPNSVPGASSGPSVAKRSPKSGPKHPKRDPKKVREHPWGPPRAPQARPRAPKERPEGAQERL